MPMQRNKYPSDWEAISKRIKEREGNRCKFCYVPNYTVIVRRQSNPFEWRRADSESEEMGNSDFALSKIVRVVITVAHLDHDTTNNAESNLAALCNRCHLVHDAQHHAQNARRTREAKKLRVQQALLSMEAA